MLFILPAELPFPRFSPETLPKNQHVSARNLVLPPWNEGIRTINSWKLREILSRVRCCLRYLDKVRRIEARSPIRFSKEEGRRAISIGSWTRLIIFPDSGAFSIPPTAISFCAVVATPRPFPWGKRGHAGIASAR